MATKVFESRYKYFDYGTILRFTSAGEFGQLNVKATADRLGKTEAEVIELVKKLDGYSETYKAGAGFWPQESRTANELTAKAGEIVAAKGMSDAQLRAKIAKLGGVAPVSAKTAELVKLLSDLLTADDDPAAAQTGEPSGAEPAADEPAEEETRAKGKKK